MDHRLNASFDAVTLERARGYVQQGLVSSVELETDGTLRGLVKNGRGQSYRQRIVLAHRLITANVPAPLDTIASMWPPQ